jgi:hypothetical protein
VYTKLCLENPRRKDIMLHLGIGRRIVLKWILGEMLFEGVDRIQS